MILIKWGTKQSDGTEKDWEVLFADAEHARDFHGDLLDRENTTYISLEKKMNRYLITWSSGIGGVNEAIFDDYQEAMEFLAETGGSASFSTLFDPDDQRDTDIEDGKY